MEERKHRGRKKAPMMLWGALCAAVLILAAYIALCVYAGRADVPPNTFVAIPGGAEPVNIGGLDAASAAEKIREGADGGGRRAVTLSCAGNSVVVETKVFRFNDEEIIRRMSMEAEETSFLSRGFRYLRALMGERTTYPLTCEFSAEGESTIDLFLSRLAEQVDREVVETSYEVKEDAVEVTKGVAGQKLDREKAKDEVMKAFVHGKTAVVVEPDVTAPIKLTAEELNSVVYVKAESGRKDGKGNVIPPVVGVSLDVERAQRLLDNAQPGKTIMIPLVFTEPEPMKEEEKEKEFLDLLSECVTYIGGSDARLNNVTLAAKKCSGLILQPGEVFDYNAVVGERTAQAGFKAAPAYSEGKTVQEIGGGICQVSSSAYWCAVYANLEILDRVAHRYAVGYVPDGMDATVSWGGPEFRFRNNSDHPVKIVVEIEGRNMKMRFYGTNTEGNYVQTERNQLSVTDYEVIYQADENIPAGTTKEEVTPYTGRKVEVYRCVYDKEGNLISRKLENISEYSKRDQVILYHPADGEQPDVSGGEAPSQGAQD